MGSCMKFYVKEATDRLMCYRYLFRYIWRMVFSFPDRPGS